MRLIQYVVALAQRFPIITRGRLLFGSLAAAHWTGDVAVQVALVDGVAVSVVVIVGGAAFDGVCIEESCED